jgi:hypothetical protein
LICVPTELGSRWPLVGGISAMASQRRADQRSARHWNGD